MKWESAGDIKFANCLKKMIVILMKSSKPYQKGKNKKTLDGDLQLIQFNA